MHLNGEASGLRNAILIVVRGQGKDSVMKIRRQALDCLAQRNSDRELAIHARRQTCFASNEMRDSSQSQASL